MCRSFDDLYWAATAWFGEDAMISGYDEHDMHDAMLDLLDNVIQTYGAYSEESESVYELMIERWGVKINETD